MHCVFFLNLEAYIAPPMAPPPQQLHLIKETKTLSNRGYVALLAANCAALFIGSVSASLLTKFYFNHGGSSRWVATLVQTAAFPTLLLPIFLPSCLRYTARKPFSGLTRRLFILSVFVGLFLGVNNLLISWGTSYLPVSTSSLLLSSQLSFTLILSALIVKQKITFNNLNSVVLLTLSSVLLAISSNHDRPKGLKSSEYFIGFACIIGAASMFSLYLPVMESIYRDVKCYEMAMEMQFIMEGAATALALVGMATTHGFKDMKREYEEVFNLGPLRYVLTLAGTVVAWQFSFMATAGMVFVTTSLTSCVCSTALLAINVLSGVVVYGDHFGESKAVSTVACAWGFVSYVYGMYVKMKEKAAMEKASGGNRQDHLNEMDQVAGGGCEMSTTVAE